MNTVSEPKQREDLESCRDLLQGAPCWRGKLPVPRGSLDVSADDAR
jgi:hypothetical protein